MNIDKAIRIFSDFLNKSWHTVIPLLLDRSYTTDESSKGDWLQSNWEILVERKVLALNEYLEIYGAGADCNGASSRITDIESFSTHLIRVVVTRANDLLNNVIVENAEYSFEQLVGFRDVFYTDIPSFDFVLVQDEVSGIERVLSLEQIKFELRLV